MPKLYIMAAVRALHEIFTVVWFGGMFTLGMAALLALWQGAGKQQIPLADSIQSRLRVASLVSIVGLAITGIMLGRTSPAAGGLFRFANPYQTVLSIKHILMILMVAIAVTRRTITRPERVSATNRRWSIVLLWINLALGVIVLYLSSLNTALRMIG